MVRRSNALMCAAVLLAPFLAAARPALRLGPGAGGEAASNRTQAEVGLQWIIRARDVLSCETPAPEFRRLRHSYRDRLAITAYVVASDTALVRSFLRNERLGLVNVVSITERDFHRRFPSSPRQPVATPMVVLTRSGAPPSVYFADVRTVAGRTNIEGLGNQLAAYFRTQVGPRFALTREEEGGKQ